jgi:hypothetical protein
MKRAAVHSRTATLPAQFGDVLREMNLKLMELPASAAADAGESKDLRFVTLCCDLFVRPH